MMSFLYLENIFEKFVDTFLLKTYKAAIVLKDLVLLLLLFDVQRFKNQKKSTIEKQQKS
jgi:hypothetical protein